MALKAIELYPCIHLRLLHSFKVVVRFGMVLVLSGVRTVGLHEHSATSSDLGTAGGLARPPFLD